MDIPIADELLVLVAVFLLSAEILALRMVHVVRRRLAGRDGDYLLRIVFRFGLIVVVAQAMTVANAILRYIDQTHHLSDIRLALFVVIESLFAVAFIGTVWEIHNLPANRHPDDSSREGGELSECLCKQINNARSTTGAVVDQDDFDTPVGPV